MNDRINYGLNYPTTIETQTDPITRDVTVSFTGLDGSRLTVKMTGAQAVRMVYGEFAKAALDPVRDAALLYVEGKIDVAEMEHRIAAALSRNDVR